MWGDETGRGSLLPVKNDEQLYDDDGDEKNDEGTEEAKGRLWKSAGSGR